MVQIIRVGLSVSFLAACASVAFAQEAAPDDDAGNASEAADVEQLKKELAAAVAKQNAVVDEYNAIIRTIKKNDELVKLDTAIAAAQKELEAAEAENAELTSARDAEQQVRAAVQQAIDQKLREHPEGARLLEQVDSLAAQRIEHQWQVQLAKFQLEHPLSPVGRSLAGDAELAKFKKMVDQAESPEEKLVAQAAYDALREKRTAAHEEGARLLAEMEDASAAALRLQESAVAIEQRLAPIRKEIERVENKRIAAAREEVAAALNTDRIKALREKVNQSIKAYNARVKELIGENEDASRLKKEYDDLAAKVKSLRDQFAQ